MRGELPEEAVSTNSELALFSSAELIIFSIIKYDEGIGLSLLPP